MYHTIQFTADLIADLVRSRKHPMERVRLRRGDKVRAQVRPYVVETSAGPIEAADLQLEDGTTARGVPYGAFRFAE